MVGVGASETVSRRRSLMATPSGDGRHLRGAGRSHSVCFEIRSAFHTPPRPFRPGDHGLFSMAVWT